MKKTLCLFGAVLTLSTALTSCSKEVEKPKNYFGTDPKEGHGTPKEAYYAFFGGIVVIVVFIVWLLKKMGERK